MVNENKDYTTHVPGQEELLDQYNASNLSISELVQKQQKLLDERPQLEKAFSELQNIVNRGRQCLRIWNQHNEILHGENRELFDLAFRYFTFIDSVLLQSAILYATKLIDKNNDSVSLRYLFNLMVQDGQRKFPENWREIKESIRDDQAVLDSFQPLIERLKTKRDKEIAHLDRTFVNSISENENYVEAHELSDFFQVIQIVLYRYHQYYFGFPPRQLQLSEQDIVFLGFEGLEDIFTLALISLDDDSIQNVSEHIKQVRSWRKSRLTVQAEMKWADGEE